MRKLASHNLDCQYTMREGVQLLRVDRWFFQGLWTHVHHGTRTHGEGGHAGIGISKFGHAEVCHFGLPACNQEDVVSYLKDHGG